MYVDTACVIQVNNDIILMCTIKLITAQIDTWSGAVRFVFNPDSTITY